MTTPNTPVTTKPAPDMAVEARVEQLMAMADQFALFYPEKKGWSASAQKQDRAAFETALRAALDRPQEVAEDDLRSLKEADAMLGDIGALLRNQTQFTGSYTEIVKQLLAASRAPVAVGVEPIESLLSELVSKICPDLDSGNIVADARAASRVLDTFGGEFREWAAEAVEYVNSASMSPSLEEEGRRLIRSAGAGGSVGAEPAFAEAAALSAIVLPTHSPTIGIEEVLDEFEDREWVWDAITAYADLHARAAVTAAHPIQAQDAAPVPAGVQGDAAREGGK